MVAGTLCVHNNVYLHWYLYNSDFCRITVSYTHLDVYKRQVVAVQSFVHTFAGRGVLGVEICPKSPVN